jgi:hypothetical protein
MTKPMKAMIVETIVKIGTVVIEDNDIAKFIDYEVIGATMVIESTVVKPAVTS